MDGVQIFDDEPPEAHRPTAAAAPDFGPHGLLLETPVHGGLAPDAMLRLRGLVEGGADPVVVVRVRLNGEDLGRFPAETVRRDVDLTGFDAVLDIARFGCRLDLRLTGLRRSGATAQVKLLTVWRPTFRPERIRVAPIVVAFRADRGVPSKVSGRVSGADMPATIDAWRAGGVTSFAVGLDGTFGGALKGVGAEAVHLWARFGSGRPDAYVGLALLSKTSATSITATVDASDGAPLIRFASADRAGVGDWRATGASAFVNGRPVALSEEGAGRPDAYRITPAWAATLPDQIGFEGQTADGRWTASENWNLSGLPLRAFMAASAAGRALNVTRGGKTSVVRALRVNPVGDDLAFIAEAVTDGGFEAVPFGDVERVAVAEEIDFASDPASPPTPEIAAFLKSLPAPGYRLAGAEAASGAVVLPVRAMAEPPAKIDRVILVCPGRNATDEIYVRRPLETVLKSIGLTLEIVDLSEGGAGAQATLDRPLKLGAVVIVSRNANDAWAERLARDRRGVFIVYLMDDDPPAAADTPGLPQRYRQRMVEAAASDFQAMLRLCDRFVVAAPAMAERYASDKTVLMQPPLIREPDGLAHFDDLGEIRIAYHGTDVHKDDIGFVYEALGATLRRFAHARLQVISTVKPPPSFRGLQNFDRLAPMAWPDYVAFARENPAHLNLAPLLDTPFNRGKSIIKVLDSASLGAAGLYSRVAPYDGVVTDGQDGFLVENDPALWEHTLGALLADPTRLRDVAEAGLATARRIGALGRASAFWRDLLGL